MSNQAYQNIIDVSADLITRAYAVRKEFTGDDAKYDDLVALYEDLRLLRNGLDRLEVILSDSMRLKAKAEILKQRAVADVEDAEVEAIGQKNPKSDFQSARESGIMMNTKTLTQRKVLRQASEAFVEASSAVDIVRNFHRGLDGKRSDIIAAMRSITFLSSYEK